MAQPQNNQDRKAPPATTAVKSKRPLVFLGVGTFNTVLDFAFYTFLTTSFFKDGEHIALAGFISGTFALICAFLTHGLITWRGAHLNHKTIGKFFVFTGFGMWVIRPILLSIFIKFTGLYTWAQNLLDNIGLHFSYNFVANTGAFALMLVIVLAYNFFVYDRYVFTAKAGHTGPENRSAS